MYCVIQKIKNKKVNALGVSKRIESYSIIIDNKQKFGYMRSKERFDRYKLDAYKITLRESYREDGKVKQKQWSVCTMSYYDILEYSIYDCASRKIEDISTETGVPLEDIYDMIEGKLNPIIDQATIEFNATEEGKAKKNQELILKTYRAAKEVFESKYGKDSYDYCYDVFGVLRNEEYLEQLRQSYSSYQEDTYSNYKDSSYQDYNWSNYGNGSYQRNSSSTHTASDEKELKKIYKKLSIKLHPDNGGSEELMQMLNRLKEIVGI